MGPILRAGRAGDGRRRLQRARQRRAARRSAATCSAAGAFTARNNTAYARTVISPTGLAIASQALHPDIVIGSDVLTLVHLDRRTGAIVSRKRARRAARDYVIDYPSGLLRFLNIILPYDDDFNPQSIVVQYQYGGPGANSTMLGGKAFAQSTPGTRADAWYLNDSIGSGNVTLLGQSVAGTTPSDGVVAQPRTHERLSCRSPPRSTARPAMRIGRRSTTHAGPLKLSLGLHQHRCGLRQPVRQLHCARAGVVQRHGSRFALSRISELDLSYMYDAQRTARVDRSRRPCRINDEQAGDHA